MRNEATTNEVVINKISLPVKVLSGERVVTFKDIDMVHSRAEGTASRNFQSNRKHFVEGEDYSIIKKADFLKDEIRCLGINKNDVPNRGLTVLTESGYLMIVKSFTDDLSWDVQRDLVKGYFKLKEVSHKLSEELPVDTQVLYKAVTSMSESFQSVCNKMESMYEARFEEFKLLIKDMAQKELSTKKEKQLSVAKVKSLDPIRDTIKPLAELYGDKSVGFNNTYRKVYAAMDVNWKYRKTKFRNINGNKNRPTKFILLESDSRLLSKFRDTVANLIVEATEGRVNA